MAKSPAFQCYPKDYLTDENVLVMTLEEEGAYWRLMLSEWVEESLPTEMIKLAKICRISEKKMKKIWENLKNCFEFRSDGRLIHPRLQKERNKQETNRANKTKAANARWSEKPDAGAMQVQCRDDADAMQMECSSVASSSAISISSADNKEPPNFLLEKKRLSPETIAALKADPRWSGIDVDFEVEKMRHYYAEKGKTITWVNVLTWMGNARDDLDAKAKTNGASDIPYATPKSIAEQRAKDNARWE